eukprot:TRINITY_DN1813_c0_g1_i1.p2 TRINITY_DN1813_c0_g1~~TRINITY_DN1813_c0_g1_i1.p2  ORF type:complete len:52 (-),score=3.06 TRINITY_DN1813_c0_g1_i1:476-631(-)
MTYQDFVDLVLGKVGERTVATFLEKSIRGTAFINGNSKGKNCICGQAKFFW